MIVWVGRHPVSKNFVTDLIQTLTPGDYALVGRRSPGSDGITSVEVFSGVAKYAATLNEAEQLSVSSSTSTVVALPYRVLNDLGMTAVEDNASIVVLPSDSSWRVPAEQFMQVSSRNNLTNIEMDTDEEYANRIQRVIDEAIHGGEGSNFVISRELRGQFGRFGHDDAIRLFSRLIQLEKGAYWTFLLSAGDRFLIGSSPERHIRQDATGEVSMNPVSGTLPIGDDTTPEDLLEFVLDEKERAELEMVVDEELKIMSRVCETDIALEGPFLQRMASVVHTGYVIRGKTNRTAWATLRDSLLAPTVVGGPLERAAKVVATTEQVGRGYYAGVLGLLQPDEAKGTLDSCIMIRTADVQASGLLRLRVGATITRDSQALSEVQETWGKAKGILRAVDPTPSAAMTEPDAVSFDSKVLSALKGRNDRLAGFWRGINPPCTCLLCPRVLVLDAEDRFTAMIAYHLRSIGAQVTVAAAVDRHELAGYDLLVCGPGPGDPNNDQDARITGIERALDLADTLGMPVLAVCLSHQIVSRRLGFELRRLPRARQGSQMSIDFFGQSHSVGLYNSFSAFRSPVDRRSMEICADQWTGEIFALRSPRLVSLQFHPESVLTVNGNKILTQAIHHLLSASQPTIPQGNTGSNKPMVLGW